MARDWLFTVSGIQPFPLDMLRYDGCFPYQSEDVSKIESTLHREPGRLSDRPIIHVRLRTAFHAPTEGRWASLGWFVSDVSRTS